MAEVSAPRKIRVGIIGAGKSHKFEIVSIADIDLSLATHCAAKFHIPNHTALPSDVISNETIELILILTADPSHEPLCISALRAGKRVFIESLCLCPPFSGTHCGSGTRSRREQDFRGYMRRYAKTFTDTFLDEIKSIDRILYARVRDIIGPNTHFVGQSGTNPVKGEGSNLVAKTADNGIRTVKELVAENFDDSGDIEVSDEEISYCRFLCGLGSHDFSLMREAIGFPQSVQAVSVDGTGFFTAMFGFQNLKSANEPFTCLYESGIDNVPRFDAHLAVYGRDKSVQIEYDTPYVKGLAIRVVVEEKGASGERVRRVSIASLEDAYTSQLKDVWDWLVEGKAVKTSAQDAEGEAKLLGLMLRKLREQRGYA